MRMRADSEGLKYGETEDFNNEVHLAKDMLVTEAWRNCFADCG